MGFQMRVLANTSLAPTDRSALNSTKKHFSPEGIFSYKCRQIIPGPTSTAQSGTPHRSLFIVSLSAEIGDSLCAGGKILRGLQHNVGNCH